MCHTIYIYIIIAMWSDLRKADFHAHNSKTHFSPSNNSSLTIQASTDAESCLGCFCRDLFLRLVRCPQVVGLPSNGCMSLGKLTAGCNSPYNWLMNLAMDLAALYDMYMWRWKWHQWMPFRWFWWRRSLCRHFLATCLPTPSYLAIHQINSWWIDRL